MITLTLGRKSRPRNHFIPDVSHVAGEGMRDLMNDTALLVTSLTLHGTVRDVTQFRGRCAYLCDQFRDALARRNYPEEIQREALIAQCGLLDEVALRYLSADCRMTWEMQPMQVERFSVYDAGRRIIDSIEKHLNNLSADVELLEFYAAILALGFMGRYARDGEARRHALISALSARIQTLRTTVDKPFLSAPVAPRLSGGLRRLAPWVPVALGCLMALIVWTVGSRTLEKQLSQIAPVKALQR
jgi:type VI secretion system protein ImpK